MADENDTNDAQFDAMMEQEAARPDLAPPPPETDEGDLTPGDMLAATVETAKADAAADPAPQPAPAAPQAITPTADEFLRIRDERNEFERRLAEIEKQGAKAGKEAEAKAGLFEDPEGWEAQRKAEIQEAVDSAVSGLRSQALAYDLEQTRARIGDERFAAIDKAATDAAARDPQFAAQLKALSPYGAGAALEKWYDQNEAILNPTAYEARLREKWLAEQAGGAPNEPPAGQKPATGANAAGNNVVKLPPSLSRQSSGRAATTADDGDDSEAAIFATGANPRRA